MPTQSGDLSPEVLNAALTALEAQKERIESRLQQVRALLGIGADGQKRRGRPPKATAVVAPGAEVQAPARTRRFSAAARARMAAQRKRWAAKKERQQTLAQPATKKRKLSAEGRKRIIEATKKRWAA